MTKIERKSNVRMCLVLCECGIEGVSEVEGERDGVGNGEGLSKGSVDCG